MDCAAGEMFFLLTSAAFRGDNDEVKMLLREGAPTEYFGPENPLVSASSQGHIDTARILIEHMANVNIDCDVDGSALNAAVNNGSHELIGLLLSHGALPCRRDRNGNVPAKIAISKNDVETLKMMMRNGDLSSCVTLRDVSNSIYLDVQKVILEALRDEDIPGYNRIVDTIAFRSNDPSIAELLR